MLKKGGYDLGRKAVYYIVVCFILIFLFVYVSNAVSKYQEKDFEALEKLGLIGEIEEVKNCFYYKHHSTGVVYSEIDMNKVIDKSEEFPKCYEKPARVTFTDKFESGLFGKNKGDILLLSKPEYKGGFHEVEELVVIREGYDKSMAVMKIEVAENYVEQKRTD